MPWEHHRTERQWPFSLAAAIEGKRTDLRFITLFVTTVSFATTALSSPPETNEADRTAQVKSLAEDVQSPRMKVILMEKQAAELRATSQRAATKAERRGYEHLNSNELTAAISDYDEAIGLDATCGLAYWGRGWAFGLQGKFKEMANDFTEAIRLGVVEADVYYNRGVAYQHLGEHQKATADFATAQRLIDARLRKQEDAPTAPTNAGKPQGSPFAPADARARAKAAETALEYIVKHTDHKRESLLASCTRCRVSEYLPRVLSV